MVWENSSEHFQEWHVVDCLHFIQGSLLVYGTGMGTCSEQR